MKDQRAWKTIAESSRDELLSSIEDAENRQHVAGTLARLTRDQNWTDTALAMVENGIPEIRSVVSWLARELNPRTYLEVGVRRGWSTCMVASRVPDISIWGFDLWVKEYAGSSNPGPEFVRQELARVGHEGSSVFVSGSSHDTLPAFLGNRRAPLRQKWALRSSRTSRPATFDLIVVDGDHSLLGAYRDLCDVLPYCSIGGAVVFDDISPDLPYEDIKHELGPDPRGWKGLAAVWEAAMSETSGFVHFEYGGEFHPGVAFAVRTK